MPRIGSAILVFAIAFLGGAWLAKNSSGAIDKLLSPMPPVLPDIRVLPAAIAPTDDQVVSSIMSAVAEPGAFRRAYRLRESLAGLDSAQLAVAFARAVKVNDFKMRETLLAALLTRWAEVSPSDAHAAVAPFLARTQAAGALHGFNPEIAVGKAWAQAFPDDALKQAMAEPGREWSVTSAFDALKSLASGDPLRALEVLSGYPDSRLQLVLAESALTDLAKTDPALAETKLDLIRDARTRANLHIDILTKLASRDPQATLDRVVQNAKTLERTNATLRMVMEVLRTAAATDAAAALASVDRLPESLRTEARGAALVGWAGKDPVGALDWAAAHGVDVAEAKAMIYVIGFGGGGWHSLIGKALETDRTKTIAWIREQSDTQLRDSLLLEAVAGGSIEQRVELFDQLSPTVQSKAAFNMVHGLNAAGVAKAEQWVRNLSAENVRVPAIRHLAFCQAANGTAPEVIAEAWPAGRERDSALAGLSYHFVHTDPARAVTLVHQIANPDKRAVVLSNLAFDWLHREEAGARAWISATADFSDDEKRVILRNFEAR